MKILRPWIGLSLLAVACGTGSSSESGEFGGTGGGGGGATCGNGVVESGETCDPATSCPSVCNDGNACTIDQTTGNAHSCNVLCSSSPITACSGGDGCCPAACSLSNDSDCSATCGNGVVDAGETCDPASTCPATCDDGNACTLDQLTGSAQNCNVACSRTAISACTAGDGCCPAGCTVDSDSDCSATCGNGVVDAGETCDPASTCPATCDDGNACTLDQLTGSAQNCNVACSRNAISACTAGDGCCPAGCTAASDADCGGGIGGTGGTGGTTGGGGGTTGGTGGSTGGTGGVSGCTGGEIFDPPPPAHFTEEVNGVSFDMVYVPGGTFTIGCESGSCPADTTPVSGVTVSSYLIGKTEVTTDLWNAVMGGSSSGFGGSHTSMTWYDAMEFACKLSQMTGKNYRITTEAEWEYAAKNHSSSLEDIGSGEEWAYNSWSSAHAGGTDPVGPNSGEHTQKTRRDAQGTADNITGRLIRSIDGVGPALRLAISAEMALPPGMVPACNLCAPVLGDEPVNSYRDPRWVTGSDARWTTGSLAIGNFDLRVWEDGTARLNGTNGQWFTSNNFALVFVPSSGSSTTFAYIFLDATQGSLISAQSFMSGGYIGRIAKESAENYAKPTLSGLRSGADLAAAAGGDYEMVDMVNIPESAREQDPRLLDGTSQGWFQDNTSAGGVHHYRKDVDPDEFRFTVNQGGNRVMLANGNWFTVNNTFLRITHSSGYTTDYLYAVDSNGTFYHNSFQAYERADFRMFQLTANGSATFSSTCGNICSDEIPKGEGPSLYANMANGHSTFVPAPCPTGGCN